MKNLTYAGRTFQTTDEVADALFDFVVALDRGSSGESVELPVIRDDGLARTVRILVWPGIELICEADDHHPDGVDNDEYASDIRARALKLRVIRDATMKGSSAWSFSDDHDLSDQEFSDDRHFGS